MAPASIHDHSALSGWDPSDMGDRNQGDPDRHSSDTPATRQEDAADAYVTDMDSDEAETPTESARDEVTDMLRLIDGLLARKIVPMSVTCGSITVQVATVLKTDADGKATDAEPQERSYLARGLASVRHEKR